jgi:hypothetical protein
MGLATIDLEAMAALVRAAEDATRSLPEHQGAVRANLSTVLLSAGPLAPVEQVLAWLEEELPGLRRRLALARVIEASTPGIQTHVAFDDGAISTRTPAAVREDAGRVAEAINGGGDQISDELLGLLEGNSLDPYFAQALAEQVDPHALAGFMSAVEGRRLALAAGSAGTSDSGRELQGWNARYDRFLDGVGTALGLATQNSGDLAAPAGFTQAWATAMTDPGRPGDASRLALVISRGGFAGDFLLAVTRQVVAAERGGARSPYRGKDYWYAGTHTGADSFAAVDPDPHGPGYTDAYDPLASLLAAVGRSPQAAYALFSQGQSATVTVGGADVAVNGSLHYLLTERQWEASAAHGLSVAIRAAVTPVPGGSTITATIAGDLNHILALQQARLDQARAEAGPWWEQFLHTAIDVAGMVPLAGELFDGANATWYTLEGHYSDATLSAGAMVPIAGWASTGGKWTKRLLSAREIAALQKMGKLGKLEDLPQMGDDLSLIAKGQDVHHPFEHLELPPDVKLVASGRKGAWNRHLNRPDPNSTYIVDNQFLYRTDANGQVIEARGSFSDLPGGHRNTYQQRVAGRADRLDGDHGGHLFGTLFGGPGEAINLQAMDGVLNLSHYQRLEKQWEAAIKDGKTVDVQVFPIRSGASLRPTDYAVRWSVDGGPVRRDQLFNGGT